jgi:hypothetical protein
MVAGPVSETMYGMNSEFHYILNYDIISGILQHLEKIPPVDYSEKSSEKFK